MELRNLFFGLLIGALFLLSALVVRPFLSYILAAVLLAFVLSPLQRRLAPAIGERIGAFLLVVLAVVVTVVPLAAISMVVIRDAAEASESIDERPILARVERLAGEFGVPLRLPEDTAALPDQLTGVFIGEFSEVVGATVHLFIGFSLVVFLLYYLLIDGSAFVRWTKDLAPLSDEVLDQLFDEANRITWAVLKGHVFVGIFQGIIGGAGLFVAGVPNVVFWTLTMILFAFVPVIGVAAVWVPAALYLLFVGETTAGLFLLVYGATVVSFVDNYLRAIIVDRGADLHPGVVLVGVLGGIYFMGALGLFIGPIILAVFKATLIVFDEYFNV